MIIYAVFANRKDDPDIVELVTAWDEFSIDANEQGWIDDKQKSLDSWGDDLLNHVVARLEVPMGKIYDALDPDVKETIESVEVVEE